MKTKKHKNKEKTKNFLYINTANHDNVEIAVINNNQKIKAINFSCERQFQIKDKLLKTIDKVLMASKLTLKNLGSIVVINKSSEMTSLRIGMATANALAYSLDIPIAGINKPSLFRSAIKKTEKAKTFKPTIPIYEINPMLKNEK